jgi:uncharacterized membrane protein
LVGEYIVAVCNTGIWRMSDDAMKRHAPMGRIFSMWVSLALLAGAILAAYGFFVWRYVEQQRKQSTTMTRTKRRPF